MPYSTAKRGPRNLGYDSDNKDSNFLDSDGQEIKKDSQYII